MQKPFQKPVTPVVQEHILNDSIRANEVRIIGSGEVMTIGKALTLASSENKDLILINESAKPPLCKIEDYSKFLYNIKKDEKERKKQERQNRQDLVEIRLTPNISDNDLSIKIKKVKESLINGDKIKLVLKFEGREITHLDRGKIVLLKIADTVADLGKPDALPKQENKKLLMIITPKK
jgi:translation initiation factor IF-3